MEDAKIIELLFERQEQALRELEKQYGKLCYQLSLRIVSDKRDAEECVNEAYLGVWNAIPPARPRSLSAFLCRIVRNISLNCYHRKKAEKRNSEYDLALHEWEEVTGKEDPVAERAELKETVRTIQGFLDTLSSQDRKLFFRRYWFFESHGMISRETGLSEKNVSVRLSRLRRKCREYLEERGLGR